MPPKGNNTTRASQSNDWRVRDPAAPSTSRQQQPLPPSQLDLSRPRISDASLFPTMSTGLPSSNGLPTSNEIPVNGHNNPSYSTHQRQTSTNASRNVANNSRPVQSSNTQQRGRSGTVRAGANGHEAARSPPKSQYDMPWEKPDLSTYKPRFADTSHVPCKFFASGTCQAGHACPFLHTTEPTQAQCKYFMKGQCKYGAACLLLHVTQDGRVLNRPTADTNANNLSIGSRINPRSQQNQGQQSALSSNLSSGTYQGTFANQIPTFQTQAYDVPQLQQHSHHQSTMAQNATRSPAGLTALDAPMPASFDSNGVSIIARHGPVAASMPGALMGPQSPPASLPRPIARANGQPTARLDLGSSPEQLEVPGARPVPAQQVVNDRRQASTLPRHGYAFDPSWQQGSGDFLGGEEFIPSDLSSLLTPEERTRRLSGRADNAATIRSSLRNEFNRQPNSTHPGSPPYGQSPSRYAEYFRQQAEAGSPEFHPVSSPLARPALQPGSVPRQAMENLSLSSSPWANSISNVANHMQRVRLGDQNNRSIVGRATSGSYTSPLQRAIGADEDVPGSIFRLEGLDGPIDAQSGQRASLNSNPSNANIWGSEGLIPFTKPSTDVSKKSGPDKQV